MERASGNFRLRIEDVSAIGFKDFENPWNFYYLFSHTDDVVTNWCVRNGLLPDTLTCSRKVLTPTGPRGNMVSTPCGARMKLAGRKGKPSGATLRCTKNRDHEVAVRTNSFFEKTKLTLQDIMVFVKSYLENSTLLQCSKFSRMHYRSTAVDWGSYIRELFKEHFHRYTKSKMLTGEIEIDESLFGRKVKYNRGNPNKGLRVWVFGMVDRTSNSIILYPVNDRRQETLLPLIQRHVEPGSRIYSDGWSAYCQLNDIGYEHFTVLHKYAFKKVYKNAMTGEVVSVDTNCIEGAWKHAKDHFRRMAGTSASQWEGHMAEVMWRSEMKGKNVYEEFFKLLKSVYTLDEPAQYHYTTPLFDSWVGVDETSSLPFKQWRMNPAMSDANSTDPESDTTQSDNEQGGACGTDRPNASGSISNPLLLSSQEETSPAFPPNLFVHAARGKSTLSSDPLTSQIIHDMFSGSSDEELDKTLVTSPVAGPIPTTSKHQAETKKKANKKDEQRMRTDKVCAPKGFKPEKNEKQPRHRQSKKKSTNPYTKSAFVWTSSDDDFV